MEDFNNTKCEATRENLDKLTSMDLVKAVNIHNALKFDAYFYIEGNLLKWGHKKCIGQLFKDYWGKYKDIELVNGEFQYVETKPKNNFKEYGFEADFEGEILKEFPEFYIGWTTYTDSSGITPCKWFKKGNKDGFRHGEDRQHGRSLKPIKKEWYENHDNFPCVVFSTKDNEYIVLERPLVPLKLNIEFRPATKEEVLKLIIEE